MNTEMNDQDKSMVEYAKATAFRLTDDMGAEWAVQQIIDAQKDTVRWEAHFADQMAGIRARNDATIARMKAYLEDYFDRVPHKATKTQESYSLPSAKLVRKAQKPLYHRDEEELLRWLETSAPDLVRAKREPNWAELKKRIVIAGGAAVFAETGEIIKGVSVEERGTKFTVTETGPEEE